jgi:aryl-alcohol dehydrogenase-like predicted oxidoreductase
MIKRPFAGFDVSILGLGAGNLAEVEDPDRLIHGAIDLGVTLIDTARSYGDSEERIGRALLGKRDQVILSTKGGYGLWGVEDWTGPCVARGVEEALGRLQTDRIDVFHLHSCPMHVLQREDILWALDRARGEGKIRVAAYSGENDELAWALHSGRFGSVQCSINVFDQRALSIIEGTTLGVLAKRPLANYAWRGRHELYASRMRAMGLELPWDEIALRFSLFAPGVSAALVGTRSLAHLAAHARSLEPLPEDVTRSIRDAFARHDDGWIGHV